MGDMIKKAVIISKSCGSTSRPFVIEYPHIVFAPEAAGDGKSRAIA